MKKLLVTFLFLLSASQTVLAQTTALARTPRAIAHRTSELFISLTPETFQNYCMVNNHRSVTAPAIVGATSVRWLINEVGPNAQKAGFDRVVVADFANSFMFPGLTGTRSEAKTALTTARRYFARAAKTVEANIDGIEPSQIQTTGGSLLPQSQQWYLNAAGIGNTTQANASGPSPSIVVIDSGINPLFSTNIDYTYTESKSFVGGSAFEDPSTTSYPDGHGTLITGIIGTVNLGISGLNWHARVVSYRIFHPVVLDASHTTLTTSTDKILQAFLALLDAPGDRLLVNCSFAYPADADDQNMELWKTAIQALGGRALIVAAAGNNADSTPQNPAAFRLPNIVSVAAIGSDGRLSSFSSYGSWVDLAGPGSDIVSTTNDGRYKSVDGTSMTVPIVIGISSSLWGFKPWLTSAQLRQLLLDGATFNPLLIGKLAAPRQLNYAGSLTTLERGRLITPTPEISIAAISPDPTHLTWGETVTVRGSNFTDRYTGTASGLKPVTWLNGIMVLINQFPVPLLSVGPEEITFVIPNDTFRVLPGNDNLSVVRFGDLAWTMSTLSWTTADIHVGQ